MTKDHEAMLITDAEWNYTMLDELEIEVLLEKARDHGNCIPPGCAFLTVILEKGQKFKNGPFIGYGKRRRAGRCYSNALKLATRRRLRYVEGFAISRTVIEQIKAFNDPSLTWWHPRNTIYRHAWCLDAEDRVVDPTWEYHGSDQYMGVSIDLDFAWRKVEESGYYGIIAGVRDDNLNAMCELYPEYKEQFRRFLGFQIGNEPPDPFWRTACQTPRREPTYGVTLAPKHGL
jgi:hypothetical protein